MIPFNKYDYVDDSEALSEAEQRIAELEAENKRLLEADRQRYILAEHMAEVKAIVDGDYTNTLEDVLDHCAEALAANKEKGDERG